LYVNARPIQFDRYLEKFVVLCDLLAQRDMFVTYIIVFCAVLQMQVRMLAETERIDYSAAKVG